MIREHVLFITMIRFLINITCSFFVILNMNIIKLFHVYICQHVAILFPTVLQLPIKQNIPMKLLKISCQ